ncbi:MAG: hypothetical protein JW966_13470 [Anaerolineae bacterium]|nr:hypothetical protein [Anaerolineae bacterium]
MMQFGPMFRRLPVFFVLVIALLLLAACGGDDSDDDEAAAPESSPEMTDEVTDQAESATEEATSFEVAESDVIIDEPLTDEAYEDAVAYARADLAGRLDVSIADITVLPEDSVLGLAGNLACPEIEGIENISLYYVYAQHERFIYPYQFYLLPAEETESELIVEACEDRLVDDEVLYVPTPDARLAIVDVVKADLLVKDIDIEAGDFFVQPMTWNDEALGCPQPSGEEPASARIEGYLIRYTLDSMIYEYHTDQTGERVEYCEPPIGYATIDALMITLEYDLGPVFELTDEVVRYDGLDKDGQLMLLGMDQWRVGLLEFDTSEDARVAAQQIEDDDAAFIYVAGYVLIVQEETSSAAYSILNRYAELVRRPAIDREQAETSELELTEAAGDAAPPAENETPPTPTG